MRQIGERVSINTDYYASIKKGERGIVTYEHGPFGTGKIMYSIKMTEGDQFNNVMAFYEDELIFVSDLLKIWME